ncbi:MAG: FlgD immunoglobulin-like domain containing protein, partial [Elusimicrobiota bacterium]
PDQDISDAVADFFSSISSPLLTNLEIHYGNIQVGEIFPKNLPDLFKGSQIILTGQYLNSGSETIRLTGDLENQAKAFDYDVNFPLEQTEYVFVPRLWASRKVGDLMNRMRLDNISTEQRDSIIEEIKGISKRYGIVTEYTSIIVTNPAYSNDSFYAFTAWDTIGFDANSKAGGMNMLAESHNVASYRVQGLKIVYPKTFVSDTTGFYIDAEYKEGEKVVDIKFASDEYFALMESDKWIGRFLSVSSNMVLAYNATNYKISDGTLNLTNGTKTVKEQMLYLNISPNPFTPKTEIVFNTPKTSSAISISLKIYSINGELVKNLISGYNSHVSGTHSVTWNGIDESGKKVSTGLYFVRLKVGNKLMNRPLVVVR